MELAKEDQIEKLMISCKNGKISREELNKKLKEGFTILEIKTWMLKYNNLTDVLYAIIKNLPSNKD